MEMETCSRSCAVHSPPQAARCSRNTLVQPYSQMTKDSTNSADGILAFHCPTWLRTGLWFQLHPMSAKHPIQRPRVSNPYQKKIPPLTKCAKPLKTFSPRCESLAFDRKSSGSYIATYKNTCVRHPAARQRNEPKNQDGFVDNVVRQLCYSQDLS